MSDSFNSIHPPTLTAICDLLLTNKAWDNKNRDYYLARYGDCGCVYLVDGEWVDRHTPARGCDLDRSGEDYPLHELLDSLNDADAIPEADYAPWATTTIATLLDLITFDNLPLDPDDQDLLDGLWGVYATSGDPHLRLIAATHSRDLACNAMLREDADASVRQAAQEAWVAILAMTA